MKLIRANINDCEKIWKMQKEAFADLLAGYDVVEFIGGNPYYLLHSIRQNNAAEILKDIATNKVFVGFELLLCDFSIEIIKPNIFLFL